MAFSSPLSPQPPSLFTYLGQAETGGPIIGGVLVGDYVNDSAQTPAGSAYNIPTVTKVSGVPVSAQLELQSTTGSLLIMRMTTTQRNALVTVVDGMMIFNSTTSTFQFYQGAAWVALSAGAGGVTGPGASTNTAIALWDGVGGTAIINSVVLVSALGAVTGITTLTASGIITSTAGALVSGATAGGFSGKVTAFPTTAASGSLNLLAVDNAGDDAVTISNASHGQASVYSIPDVGAATGQFNVVTGALVSGNVMVADGTAGVLADGGFAVLANTTATYAGGGTSNAYVATGLGATSIVTATILASTNAVSIVKAVPSANTLTVTFSADPGAATTVSWIAITPAV